MNALPDNDSSAAPESGPAPVWPLGAPHASILDPETRARLAERIAAPDGHLLTGRVLGTEDSA